MNNYPDKHRFKASQDTLTLWLSTRKLAIPFSNLKEAHPGIFRTDGYTRDRRFFKIAMTGELLGGAAIIVGAATFDYISLIISIVGVLGIIWVDIRIARSLHRNKAVFKYIEGKILILKHAGNGHEGKRAAYLDYMNLKSHKQIDALLKILLYLIATIKSFFFFYFIVIHPLIYIFMTVLYFYIAYIHVKHTGYKFAEDDFQKGIKSDRDKWMDEEGENDGDYYYRIRQPQIFGENAYSQIPFIDNGPKINKIQIDSDIILEPDDKVQNQYILKCLGMIFDHEIIELRNKISDGAQKDHVTLECLKYQYTLLGELSIKNKKAKWN